MPFQSQVQPRTALGVAGDFATSNPRAYVPAGEAGYVASAAVTIGRFAWITGDSAASTGSGVPDGVVPREGQGLNTVYLADAGMTIPIGFPVNILSKGDLMVVATVGAAVKGNKAFAKLTDGTVQFAAAGATVSGFIETPWVCTRACLVNELATISL